jgi:hypothetical protein
MAHGSLFGDLCGNYSNLRDEPADEKQIWTRARLQRRAGGQLAARGRFSYRPVWQSRNPTMGRVCEDWVRRSSTQSWLD